MTSGGAYLVGREVVTELTPGTNGQNQIFASVRADGTRFTEAIFEHCTFANVSFKNCHLLKVNFSNCAFLDCYFREARLEDCRFSGCKFIGSDLVKVDIRSCDFRYYNSFHNCFIKYDQLKDSIPVEGNLRARICANLAQEAAYAGFSSDEGKYRQLGAKAWEAYQYDAARGATQWFRDHYSGMARVSAAYRLIVSRLRGYAWGYRRSWLVVLRNWAVLALIAFPLLFLMCRSGLQRDGKPTSIADAWLASLGNMLPGSGISDVKFVAFDTLILAFTEAMFGLLFVGLIAALLLRSVFERGR